jgi:hypothetical protein
MKKKKKKKKRKKIKIKEKKENLQTSYLEKKEREMGMR